ncbi:response regulator [Pseudomonas sp. B21-040]|uniref:hybrid sensor histidine kinase/response regulator n=1 Tax=Pseudomonas sp. B21-040 TaxID=2895486 RepID=UPI00215E4977|nr:hybrid sensor histidine kinase/response regulator [Pseudomonas sp. B21-040]UVL43181.1 response regulator [Pseudomonas sp. B21-040]
MPTRGGAVDKRQFQLSNGLLNYATTLAVLLLCAFFCFHLYSVFLSAVSRYDNWSNEHTQTLFLRTEAEALFISSTSRIIQSTSNTDTKDHTAVFSRLSKMPAMSVNETDGVNGFGRGVLVRGKDALSEQGEHNFFTQAMYLSNIQDTVWQDTYNPSHRFLVAAATDEIFSLPTATNDWENLAQNNPVTIDLFSRIRDPILRDYSRLMQNREVGGWTEAHASPLHQDRVISRYTPVSNSQGTLVSFLVGEIPVSELVNRKWLQKYDMRLAIFDPSLKLVAADSGFDNAEKLRANVTAVSSSSNLNFEIDGGWLLIYSVAPQSHWRMVYGVPLATVLVDNAMAIGFSLAYLIIGLTAIFFAARGVRRYLLVPAQRRVMKISESHELIQVLMDHSPVGLCLMRRPDGAVLIQNEQARQLLKFTVNESGQPCVFGEFLLNIPAENLRSSSTVEINVQAVDSDKHVHILATLKDVQYHDQPVLFCALVDYSERKSAELLLATAKKTADEANAAKSTFLAMMSHEIRTPLYGVLGTLELLANTALQPQQLDYLNTIELSSSNLLQIINDILDFSKIEAKQLTLECAPFNLLDLVESVARGFLPIAWKRHVELYGCLQPDVPSLMGDRNRLHQVLNNLLSNAVKFTDSGKIVVRLEGHEVESGQFNVKLQITDSGIGIAKASQAKLFEPFIQADNSTARQFGGTGLGLSICRRLVQLMGGRIELVSELGLGSSFTVTLRLPIAGPASSIHLDHLLTVYILADAGDQRENLQAQIQHAGGQAQALGETRSPSTLTSFLVVARPHDPDPDICEDFAAVIWLEPDGVTTPQWREDGWHVSSLSQQGLLQALQLANGNVSTVSNLYNDRHPETPKALHVLAVEDHPINQLVLTEQLEQLGCQVTMASDGREALQIWQRGDTFDVMLTDVNMPHLDGYQLARQLRADGVDIPIVGVTANAHAEEGERCRQAGMDAHLAKPFSLASLREALNIVGAIVDAPEEDSSTANILSTLNGIKPSMRELFVSTTRSDWATMMAAISDEDAVVVSQYAHRLKGAFATVGLIGAAENCSQIETLSASGRLSQIDEHLQRLKQFLNPILEASS